MKKLLAFLLFPVFCFAQNQTTGNLIYSTVNPAPPGTVYQWSGFNVTETTGGGVSGGNVPSYNVNTGTFYFGYMQSTIAYTMAVNSALSGTGIQLTGINYGLQYYNQEFNRGNLSTNVTLRNSEGVVLQSYSHALGTTTNGWTNFDQTKTFNNPYSLASIGNVSMTFSGKDDRFWAGYYGPMVRNPYITFNYSADVCASNPLSSPDCPGYAAAYLTQQCSINPLYSPSCPGYFTAQCNISQLYSQACPGYQAAYFAQQCSLNPLYNSTCPGYAEAYFTQQCNLNGLYSNQCPNYAEAYAKKYVLNIDTTGTGTKTTANAPSTTEATTTISNDGKVKTEVSKTGNTTVDSVLENRTTSTTANVTAPVQLAPSGGQSVNTQASTQTQQDRTQTASSSPSNERQQPQQARNEKNESKDSKSSGEMKQAAQQKAQQEMKKAENASSFEAQVAVQGNVIAAMGFVPGFNAYAQANVPDVLQAQLQRQYSRDAVDNRRALRLLGGGQDRLHQEMINQQYNLR